MNILLCEHKSGQMLQAVKRSRLLMHGFRFRSILYYSERCAKKLSSGLSIQMFGRQIFMFEPTSNLFSRYVSADGSKRRYHSSRVSVYVARRDSCRFRLSVGEFSSSRNRFLRRTPSSQDHFALQQLLWPDFST